MERALEFIDDDELRNRPRDGVARRKAIVACRRTVKFRFNRHTPPGDGGFCFIIIPRDAVSPP